MHKAFGYTFAWILSYGLYIVAIIIEVAGGAEVHPIIIYIYTVSIPLQGFFNLAIFMYPRIVTAKKSSRGENISWCQAFSKAFWSRGTNARKKHLPMKDTRRLALETKKRMRRDSSREEEKCEIQIQNAIHHNKKTLSTYASNIPSTGTTTKLKDSCDKTSGHGGNYNNRFSADSKEDLVSSVSSSRPGTGTYLQPNDAGVGSPGESYDVDIESERTTPGNPSYVALTSSGLEDDDGDISISNRSIDNEGVLINDDVGGSMSGDVASGSSGD